MTKLAIYIKLLNLLNFYKIIYYFMNSFNFTYKILKNTYAL